MRRHPRIYGDAVGAEKEEKEKQRRIAYITLGPIRTSWRCRTGIVNVGVSETTPETSARGWDWLGPDWVGPLPTGLGAALVCLALPSGGT